MRKRNDVVDYAVLVLAVLMAFCAGMSFLTGTFFKERAASKQQFAVSDGWHYADGTAVTEENRSGRAWENGTLSVFKTVTKEEFGKALYFRNYRQDVTVIADKMLLYDTCGDGNYPLRHCFNGHCMAVLPQGEETYTVEVRFGATSEAPCTVPVIMIDNPGRIEATALRESAPVLLQSIVFLTIALLSLGVWAYVLFNGGTAKAVLYGACYIICQSLWALCDADITDILPISNELTDVVGYFLIVLRSTLLIAFGKEFVARERQKPLSFCMWGLNLFQLMQVVLYLAGLCRLYDLHAAGMAVSAVALTVFTICMIRELVHRKSCLIGLLALGVAANAVMSILSQMLYFTPAVAVAYQKIYRPLMLVNDTIVVIVLVATAAISGIQTVKNRIQSATELASRAENQAKALRKKVDQDSLTGLMNHRAIMECVNIYACGTAPFAVGFVDLDDFRDINTKYGHLIGDQVIRFVAKAMQDTFQAPCGRHGGDEFVFLVEKPECLEHLEQLLTQYQRRLTQEVVLRDSGEHVEVSCSIGVIRVNKLPQNYNTIVNKADDLMYRAKSMGKNQFIIESI